MWLLQTIQIFNRIIERLDVLGRFTKMANGNGNGGVEIGNNGKMMVPLALLLFILLETGAGIWQLSKLNSQVESLQMQLNNQALISSQIQKTVEDKIELYRLEAHKNEVKQTALEAKMEMLQIKYTGRR